MTTTTPTNPIEIPSYDKLFPFRSLYHRIENLLLRLPQQEAFDELSYVILKSAELTNLDPTLPERSNDELRAKLSSCRAGGNGTILLKGKNTQIPLDVFDHVMQIASNLDISELHAIALYAEAVPTATANGVDPCQATVEFFYEDRVLILKALLELIPYLGGKNDNSSMYIRSLLMDRTKPINLVQQMLTVISKFVPIYNASSSNKQQGSSFIVLRDSFYRQVMQYASSILFYLFYGIDASSNEFENLKLIIESLQQIASGLTGGNGACEFVVSKLVLTCLNAFAVGDDPSIASVMDMKQILCDVDAWSGEAECVRGLLISAYAVYLDSISSAGYRLPDGFHVDELNKYLREAYEFCIFSYIRSKVIPSLLFDESKCSPSSIDQTFFLGVIVGFVGDFTAMAVAYNDLPQTLTQWKEDQDYNAQLSHTQEDYSDRDDVLEDIVELIIELCQQRHESALRFYNVEMTTGSKQELSLSSFIQEFCLPHLPLELGSTLILALSHEDGICAVNSYLQSKESKPLNWDNLFSIVSQYSQKRYYSAYTATSLDLETISDVYQVKLVLALIARCAANKEVRKSLLSAPNNILQIILSFPVMCLESLCAVANLIDSNKTLARILEWIDRQNISNPDILTTRGLLQLYSAILRYISVNKEVDGKTSSGAVSIKVNRTTETFLNNCTKWVISQSNDASLISHALQCISLEPSLSSDDKICKSLLQLLVRSRNIGISVSGFDETESKISRLLGPKLDFMSSLLCLLCKMETQHVLLDVKNILDRLAVLLMGPDPVNLESSLKYIQHLVKNRDLWVFLFDSIILENAFVSLLTLPDYATKCVELIKGALPISMNFIAAHLEKLIAIDDQYQVTALLCEVKEHPGHLSHQILTSLHRLGYVSQELRNNSTLSLSHLANLVNLYSAELFTTKFSHFDVELVTGLTSRITFRVKSNPNSTLSTLTDGKSMAIKGQVDFNCAFGRNLALLSSNTNILHVNDFIYGILFQIKNEIIRHEVDPNCFYPIALGLFDFCTEKKDLMEPIMVDITDALFSTLSSVGAVAGVDLLCLLMALCSSTKADKRYLELAVKIYIEYGLRSEPMTASITYLLGACDTNFIDYNTIRRLVNTDDLVILTKLAEEREGSALLVQYGAPTRVVNAMPSTARDPEVLVPVLNFLLGIQRHFDVSPEIAQVLIRNNAFFRQQLLHQFPYFADVTEVFLQALVSSKDSDVDKLYGQSVYEFMKILMHFPFPAQCLDKITITGLDDEGLSNGVCWWDAFPSPGPSAFSLPLPPINATNRIVAPCAWTNEHYLMATTAIRILDLCACYLIKLYRSRTYPGVLSICPHSFARALCRFVIISHALESYYLYSEERLTANRLSSPDQTKKVELEYISRLGAVVARFSERLIAFLVLHFKVSIDAKAPDIKELARSFKLALDHCRVDFKGVGFSAADSNGCVLVEEKKQVETSRGNFSQRTSSILREFVDRFVPQTELLSRERTGLIPRDNVS